jgi:nickel transport protein
MQRHTAKLSPPLGLAALTLALCLLCPLAALAHKVSVFAYVDGPNIVVDAFYSKSNKVNQGKITVQNAATGEEYLRATTDERGALVLPVPTKAVAAKADLRILLVAGEGHQNEVLVAASEYAGLTAPAQPVALPAKPLAKAGPKPGTIGAPGVARQAALPSPQLDEAALARIVEQAVERAVDSRMAPVKRLLLESAKQGPGPTEIVGGIGYIVGLFGVAAFLSARRKDRPGK